MQIYFRDLSPKHIKHYPVLMLVAIYYINICKGTHKHLTFLEYKINAQSILQSHKQITLENYRMQNFLKTETPF